MALAGLNAQAPSTLLTSYLWKTPPASGSGEIRFSQDTISIKPTTTVPSNSMGGSYTLVGVNQIRTSPLTSTLMGIQDPTIENFMSELWNNRTIPFAIEVDAQNRDSAVLSVLDSKGTSTIQFQGTITPDAKFGTVPETQFFEIKPVRVGTQNPTTGIPNTSGFEVRQLFLDPTTFVVVKTGDWVQYNGEINDLKPSNTEIIGVRVKKFTVPADTNSPQRFAYFNDLVYSRTSL